MPAIFHENLCKISIKYFLATVLYISGERNSIAQHHPIKFNAKINLNLDFK